MPNILLVDDEPRIVSFLEKGLRKRRCSSEIASDGSQALEMAFSDRFDLMLLDLGLPGMDGLDVLAALRAENNSLPVMILTARGESACQQAMELGANDYMQKPFSFRELYKRLQALLPES
ncbi:MAG: response regulator transcription factor [Leptolyngbya sp. SIO1D8]|nr:response regulator transcription factor [Leptolyngbya sp. SIO1D8]